MPIVALIDRRETANTKRTRKLGGARDRDYRLLVGYNSMPEGIKEAIRDNAKHRQEHPDPIVAASALTWAYGRSVLGAASPTCWACL
jgi:hypothetical protein